MIFLSLLSVRGGKVFFLRVNVDESTKKGASETLGCPRQGAWVGLSAKVVRSELES